MTESGDQPTEPSEPCLLGCAKVEPPLVYGRGSLLERELEQRWVVNGESSEDQDPGLD